MIAIEYLLAIVILVGGALLAPKQFVWGLTGIVSFLSVGTVLYFDELTTCKRPDIGEVIVVAVAFISAFIIITHDLLRTCFHVAKHTTSSHNINGTGVQINSEGSVLVSRKER